MRCDACREPIGDAFYVVDGQDWCPRCQRSVARRTPAWRGMLGGLAGGVAAVVVVLTVVSLLPRNSAAIHLAYASAIPAGLLVGVGVRLGRRDYRSPVLPMAAAALTFLPMTVAFAYGLGNLDEDQGYLSMAEILALVAAADVRMAVLLTALPVVMVFDGIVGALSFLSLVIGMSASSAVAGGDPIAIDGPFETTPEPAPAPAL